jgi:hypothetical protein
VVPTSQASQTGTETYKQVASKGRVWIGGHVPDRIAAQGPAEAGEAGFTVRSANAWP